MLSSSFKRVSLLHTVVLVVISILIVVGVAWISDILLVQRSMAVRFAESAVAKRLGILTDFRKDVPRTWTMHQIPWSPPPPPETTWPLPIPSGCRGKPASLIRSTGYIGASYKHIATSVSGPSEREGCANFEIIESGLPFRAFRRARGDVYYSGDLTSCQFDLEYGSVRISRRTILPVGFIWHGMFANVLVYFFLLYTCSMLFLSRRYRRRIRCGCCPYCRYMIGLDCSGCAECGWMK